MPEPNGRRRATPPASYGSTSHPAIIVGKDSRKADAVFAPNQNIENNPMQSALKEGAHGRRDEKPRGTDEDGPSAH